MLIKIAVFVIVVLAAFFGYASTQPDTFHYQRTATIKAPPEKIFPLINSMKAWQMWSPYEKLDPNMKKKFTGPDSGVGAGYEWEGNSKAGAGRVEVTEAVAPSKVRMGLHMLKPFKADNHVEFTLVTKGNSTDVTWAIGGEQPLLAKAMGLLLNCEKMVTAQFDEGLASLKALAEK